jgi:hypothetical protein
MRGIILVFVIGLVVLISALLTPSVSINGNFVSGPAGSEPNQIYFLQPGMDVSISISNLQGSATLLVQQMNGDASFHAPIVNVSVVAQDIVTFSISNRGYYDVSVLYTNGTIPSLSYVLDESGTPSDTLIIGIALIGIAAALYLTVVFNSKMIIKKRMQTDRPFSKEKGNSTAFVVSEALN